MSQPEQELLRAFGVAANAYKRETVIGAAANLLLNALRQSHPTLGACQEELDDIVARMKTALREDHYDPTGQRYAKRVILPAAGLLRGRH